MIPVIRRTTYLTYTHKNCFLILIYLYFFTTSADLLHVEVSLFRCKINHILALILFLLFSLKKKQWILPNKPILITFLITLLSMTISGACGAYPFRSLSYVLIYLFTFLVYFILPFNIMVEYGRVTIFKLYLAAFVATGIIGVLQFFLSFGGVIAPFVTQFAHKFSRGQAMTYEPSYYALFMIPYVMYYNARYLFETKMFDIPKLSSLFFKNLLLLASTSTGAFFSYFIFIFVSVFAARLQWVREYKHKIYRNLCKITALLVLGFSCIAALLPELFLTTFWKFFLVGFLEHHSFFERWQGIVSTWNIFLAHPMWGMGVGGVGPAIYQDFFSQGRSIAFQHSQLQMFEPYDPTNVFLEMLASLGCVGLIAFIMFFYFYYSYLAQTAKQEHISNEEKSKIYGLIVSIGVMLIVLQFNQNLFRSYVWVHLAICMGYMYCLRVQDE